MSLHHKVGFAAVALAFLAATAHAQNAASPVLPEFPPDREVCFGRDYDRRHLAAHPQQKVTRFFLMRSLSDDPRREERPRSPAEVATANIEWEKTTRAEGVTFEGTKPGRSSLDLFVALRNRPGVFKQTVECRKLDGAGFTCGVDCDGGGFKVEPEAQGSLLVRLGSSGVRVQSGCGGDESAPEVRVEPGRDDKTFRLSPLAIAACHAARDDARPEWAQTSEPPLRERFAREASVCFTSTGNLPASLARRFTRITLATQGKHQPRKKAPDDDSQPDLHVELRATPVKGKPLVRRLECRTDEYTFDCSLDNTGFRLTTRSGGGATIRERYYDSVEISKLLGGAAGKSPPIALKSASPDACR